MRHPLGTQEGARGVTVIVCTYKRAASLTRFLDSLALQEARPKALLVVDASPDDQTEKAMHARTDLDRLARRVCYFRVAGAFRGLTRQRNFGLRWVETDLVAFFDDDIVLLPGCLREMEHVHREFGEGAVGVGAWIVNGARSPSLLWRTRHFLGAVHCLKPGTYDSSGMSTPWSWLEPTGAVFEGDWLPGGATMWRTEAAEKTGFPDTFEGYAQGEDLDFSLRVRHCGLLLMATGAHAEHLHHPSGRPSHFTLGYIALFNRYQIHRRVFGSRACRKTLVFAYAWTIDSVLLLRRVLIPSATLPTLQQLAGRIHAAFDILRSRQKPEK